MDSVNIIGRQVKEIENSNVAERGGECDRGSAPQGGLWDCLSKAIPSMGGLIRFITSQISGGACCQIELSAWPVIRASNESRARV